MKRDKQSNWIIHDGSKHSPVPETMLIGDCEMKDGDTVILVKGAPIAAKSIYWSGVRRYRTVNALAPTETGTAETQDSGSVAQAMRAGKAPK